MAMAMQRMSVGAAATQPPQSPDSGDGQPHHTEQEDAEHSPETDGTEEPDDRPGATRGAAITSRPAGALLPGIGVTVE